MQELVKRMQNGVKLLDIKNPGWEDDIDLEILNMNSCRDCVLGQLYGEYQHGARHLGLLKPQAVGYSHGTEETGFYCENDWQELTNLWSDEICRRQEE